MSCIFFETDLCDILTLPYDDGPITTFFGVGLGVIGIILDFAASKIPGYKSDYLKLISVKVVFMTILVILGMALTFWLAAWSFTGAIRGIVPLIVFVITGGAVLFYVHMKNKKV